jgi:methylated-DNA-[protein]-cysteine S-methyltransferase
MAWNSSISPDPCYLLRTPSPLGELEIFSNGQALTGLYFPEHKYQPALCALPGQNREELQAAAHWLDCYFAKRPLPPLPALEPQGTPFRRLIWNLLLEIPYGETVSYGALAKKAGEQLGKPNLSAQAVGGAVGHNPISIFIPCHRVVGADGSLTGYAGGLWRKQFLLELEQNS